MDFASALYLVFVEALEAHACKRKITYWTMWLATIASYSMDQNKPPERFEPYQCQHCGHYHVGHARADGK